MLLEIPLYPLDIHSSFHSQNTKSNLGSSLSIWGSHRVSTEITGRENLKVFADFRHSWWFSWGILISMVLGSSPTGPTVIRMTNINFIIPPLNLTNLWQSINAIRCLWEIPKTPPLKLRDFGLNFPTKNREDRWGEVEFQRNLSGFSSPISWQFESRPQSEIP